MPVTREQVMVALEALLGNVPGINSVSRRMAMPNEYLGAGPGIIDERLPALLLWEQNEDTQQRGRGTPATRTWEVWLVVYFQNGDPTIPGSSIVNPILEAIEAALTPSSPAFDTLTLGGLVSHCWIEGQTVVALGDIETKGFGGLIVPVRILVP